MHETHYHHKVRQVRRILIWTLVANWIVAGGELIIGFLSGTVSMVAEGFHSLLDGSSNIIGLISLSAASKPADTRYPYGRRKYETFAAVGISMLLVLACYEIIKESVHRLGGDSHPLVSPLGYIVMIVSVVINYAVANYEHRRGQELKSSVLVADAHHTHSDVYGSLAVLVSLIAIQLGYAWVDIIASLFVVALIGRAVWEILSDSLHTLVDISRVPVEEIEKIALQVPGVRECHNIRSRGMEDAVYIDLHIGVDPGIRIETAHEIGCEVERQLLTRLTDVADVVVHSEPARALSQIIPDEALRLSLEQRDEAGGEQP
jgi:cation diffusion facilitator family transporter